MLTVWEVRGERLATLTSTLAVHEIGVTIGVCTKRHRSKETDGELNWDLGGREGFPWPQCTFESAWQNVRVWYDDGNVCWFVCVLAGGGGGGMGGRVFLGRRSIKEKAWHA